ncbi:MAG: VOC family protein [Acidimicrobiales bacterium]
MPIADYSLVALDCPEPRQLAEFYRAIIGGDIVKEDDDWVELRTANAATVAFQRAPGLVVPAWPDGGPQQMHLDFDVADLDEAERAVLAVGARKAEFQPKPGDWRVFLDPIGHPFCLVRVGS